MTTQDAYERMRAWLTRPGASRSYLNGTGNYCCYITPDGNRCAIGAILSQRALDEIEQAAVCVTDLVLDEGRDFPFAKSEVEDLDLDFLQAAQDAHDDIFNWEGEGAGLFAVRVLDELAVKHGLQAVVEREIVVF